MELGYLFKLNDWKFKRFILIMISLQMALFGSIGLDLIGLPVPLLRQILGFISLSFIPGFLILRIMKIHNHETIPTILYSLGISLAILMFSGFFMNLLYPFLDVPNPITLFPIIYTLNIEIFFLCIIAYFIDRSYYNPQKIDFSGIISPSSVFFCLLPVSAILAAYVMNVYKNNLLMLLILPIIALIPFLIISDRYLNPKLYPFAILSTSLALLFHVSFISMFVSGWDINQEIFLASLIKNEGIWNPSAYGNLNAMLSITTLAPIYSIILSMKFEGIFKVVYPFLFAFVPVGLFQVFRKQTNDKIAFFSCFFFISLFTFFMEMLALARQEIAEFFIVLILLVFIDSKINRIQKSVFLIIFSISLIVSHYGLSYIFLFLLISSLLFSAINDTIKSVFNKGDSPQSTWLRNLVERITLERDREEVSIILIIFYGIMILSWYIYTSSASSFESIVWLGNKFTDNIFSELLNPNSVQGLNIIVATQNTLLREITKYLQLLMIFFIVIGYLVVYLKWEKSIFNKKYIILSFFALILCIGGVTLPYIADSLNTSRLYQISLIFLAPFCAIGGIYLFNKLYQKKNDNQLTPKKNWFSLIIFSALLTFFLLFNSMWMFEVFYESNASIALNPSTDGPVFNEMEHTGAIWLGNVNDGKFVVTADEFRGLLFTSLYGRNNFKEIGKSTLDSTNIGYVFAGSYNIKHDMFSDRNFQKIISLSLLEQRLNTIYSAGGSLVLIEI